MLNLKLFSINKKMYSINLKSSLSAVSPTKINLALHVTGHSANHKLSYLESLVIFVNDLADHISIETQENRDSIKINGPFAHLLQNNPLENISLLKTLNLFRYKLPSLNKKLFNFILHKNIPIGAGLGGGSSNAATTWKLLCKYYEVNYLDYNLTDLMAIGADTPVCVYGKPAFVSGFGEKIKPVNINSEIHILLIYPKKPLETKQVFANNILFSKPLPTFNTIKNFKELINYLQQTHNTLQNSAIQILPEISESINALNSLKNCAIARMSGSGSTTFGLFETRMACNTASNIIKRYYKQWDILIASYIP